MQIVSDTIVPDDCGSDCGYEEDEAGDRKGNREDQDIKISAKF
jgi:hypothetical protein